MVPHLYCFSIFFQSSHFSLIHHQSTSPFLCFWTRATVAKSGVTFASLPKYVQKSSSPTPGGRGRWGGGILGLGGVGGSGRLKKPTWPGCIMDPLTRRRARGSLNVDLSVGSKRVAGKRVAGVLGKPCFLECMKTCCVLSISIIRHSIFNV